MTRHSNLSDNSTFSRLLTIPEAAEFLRLSRMTIYKLIRSGELCHVKIGKACRIPLASVIALIEAKTRHGIHES